MIVLRTYENGEKTILAPPILDVVETWRSSFLLVRSVWTCTARSYYTGYCFHYENSYSLWTKCCLENFTYFEKQTQGFLYKRFKILPMSGIAFSTITICTYFPAEQCCFILSLTWLIWKGQDQVTTLDYKPVYLWSCKAKTFAFTQNAML